MKTETRWELQSNTNKNSWLTILHLLGYSELHQLGKELIHLTKPMMLVVINQVWGGRTRFLGKELGSLVPKIFNSRLT